MCRKKVEKKGEGCLGFARLNRFFGGLIDILLLLEQDTLILVNEPLHGLGASDTLVLADDGGGSSAVLDTLTGATENDIDIHTIDTNGRIVLDTKIDVLLDTETEVAVGGEVALEQLVLLDLQGLLEDLLGLRTTHGGVHGDLFITTDTEGTDGVTSLRVNGGLSSQLVEHYTTIISHLHHFPH